MAFSKAKQDVWVRLVWHMNVPYEPVCYKGYLLFGSENDPVSVSLTFLGTGFSSDQEKVKSPQGRNTKAYN